MRRPISTRSTSWPCRARWCRSRRSSSPRSPASAPVAQREPTPVSTPWRTVAEDEDVEDEGRGTDEGPLLSLLTRASTRQEGRTEPARAAEATGEGGQRRGGGDRSGGGGERGGPGDGAKPSHPATAWWRAERLLPHGLRVLTFIPLVALVVILAVLLS